MEMYLFSLVLIIFNVSSLRHCHFISIGLDFCPLGFTQVALKEWRWEKERQTGSENTYGNPKYPTASYAREFADTSRDPLASDVPIDCVCRISSDWCMALQTFLLAKFNDHRWLQEQVTTWLTQVSLGHQTWSWARHIFQDVGQTHQASPRFIAMKTARDPSYLLLGNAETKTMALGQWKTQKNKRKQFSFIGPTKKWIKLLSLPMCIALRSLKAAMCREHCLAQVVTE